MGVPITTFAPEAAPDEVLLPAAAVTAAVEAESFEVPPLPAALEAAQWRVPDPDHDRVFLVAGDPADPDGVAVSELDLTEENGHVATVAVCVPRGRRRCGVGRELLARAEERAREAGRRLLLAESASTLAAVAEPFAAATGFEKGLVMRQSGLLLDGVDRALVERWAAGSDEGAYELHLVDGALPDDLVPPFLEAVLAMNDAPRDGLDVADDKPRAEVLRYWEDITFAIGGRRVTALAVHRETGAGAGFSNLWYTPEQPGVAWQGGTGVARDHRGHRLGQVMKARVLQDLLREVDAGRLAGSTRIRTDNAHTNPWMLRINDDLGFVPCGDIVEWQKQL